MTFFIQTKRRGSYCYDILMLYHDHPSICPSNVILDISHFFFVVLFPLFLMIFHTVSHKRNLNYIIKSIRPHIIICIVKLSSIMLYYIGKWKWKCLFNMTDWLGIYCKKLCHQIELVISPIQKVISFIRIGVITYSSFDLVLSLITRDITYLNKVISLLSLNRWNHSIWMDDFTFWKGDITYSIWWYLVLNIDILKRQ